MHDNITLPMLILCLVLNFCLGFKPVFAADTAQDKQLNVEILDGGQVNIRVNGELCLTDFRVLLAGPAWKYGYATVVSEKTIKALPSGLKQVDIEGKILRNSTTYGTFNSIIKFDTRQVKLHYEIKVEKDFEVETIRLNGLLPCELSAGKASWHIVRPGSVKSGGFPERFEEGGADFGDSGFDWFGWILPSGNGIKFIPDWSGIQDFYLQDGRRWGGEYFQVCWTIIRKGWVHKGDLFSCDIAIEILSSEEVAKKAFKLGQTMLSVQVACEPVLPDYERVKVKTTIRNLVAQQRHLQLKYLITDEVFAKLKEIKEKLSLPAMGSETKTMEIEATTEGDYRLAVEIYDETNQVQQKFKRRFLLDVLSGLRNRISLNGEWEFMAIPDGKLIYPPPPTGNWKKRIVPSGFDSREINHRSCWYRRQFDVPRFMAGKRIKLKFMAVNFAAVVYVNGKFAGSHFGGFLPFTIDITDLVKIGSTNELCVGVTAWTAASAIPIEAFELKEFEHPGWKLQPNSIIAPIGSWFFHCGIWQDVFLLAYPKVYVEDVFVMTSVRKKEIKLEVTLRNEDSSSYILKLENVIFDNSGLVKRLKPKEVEIAAGATAKIELTEPWQNPKLWSLDNPHLYRLQTSLKANDKLVDIKSTRFGFREIWTDKHKIILNGMPINLFATSWWGTDRWEDAVSHILKVKAANCRAMRLHTRPCQPLILDAADELGLLIIDEAAVYCYQHAYATQDKRFWDNYAKHLKDLALRDRNHPSLFMYSLENEILHCGGKPEVWEPELARLSDILREVDPTRLITYEADLDPGGKADVIGLHYPQEYWSGYTLYPEKCYWMEKEITTCGRRWKWKRDKPLYIGEFEGGFFAWYPRFQAFWSGDCAYVVKERTMQPPPTNPNAKARIQMLIHEIAAYRYYGVAGLCPWVFGDELVELGKIAFSPLFLYIREHTKNFYSGESIQRTVYIHNDEFSAAKLLLKWQLKLHNKVIAAGNKIFNIKPTEFKSYQIKFKAPQVKQRQELIFMAQLYKNAKLVFKTEQQLLVYPKSLITSSPKVNLEVGLYDEVGKTKSVLEELKVNYKLIEDLSKLPADIKLLIIGYRSLNKKVAENADRIAKFVKAGGRVICFEQESYPENWLPIQVSVDPEHSCTIAFPRAVAHPILKGIEAENLKFWRDDYIVARNSIIKPTKGNYKILIDAGGIQRNYRSTLNGLSWAPLLELPYHKGFYLLCQLQLTNKFKFEPSAKKLLMNLLEYASSAPENEYNSVAVLAEPEGTFRRTLDSLGLIYDSLLGKLAKTNLSTYGLILVDNSELVWGEIKSCIKQLKEFVDKGGIIWLHNLKPAIIEPAKDLLEINFSLKSMGAVPLYKTMQDPILSGLSNHELYWEELPIWDQLTPMRRIADYVVSIEGANPEVKILTEPAGLIKIEFGKGFFIIDQLLWDSTDKNKTEGLRIASILLTNLGARLEAPRFNTVKHEDYFQVDLKAYCNLGFEGEIGKGGWMAHGEEALKELPFGLRVMAGIPFEIIDPAKNFGKSCIALKGTHRPHFPVSATGIKINRKASKLYFLHTCAWGYREGELAAYYIVHYEDGQQVKIPLRINIELRDWYAEPVDCALAEVAWKGMHKCDLEAAPKLVGIYAMEWVNPYPDKIITSIDFISAENTPVPVLIAISGKR